MWYWHSTIKSVSQEVLLKQYKPINSLGNLQPSLQNTVCFVAQKFMATNPTGEHGPEHTKPCFCGFFCPFALWLLCCWITLIFKRSVLSETLDSCKLSFESPRVLPSQLGIFWCIPGAQGGGEKKGISCKMASVYRNTVRAKRQL